MKAARFISRYRWAWGRAGEQEPAGVGSAGPAGVVRPALAADARAARKPLQLEWEAGQPIPLVVLDANIPEIDAFMLVAQIRADSRLASATILMLADSREMRAVPAIRDSGVPHETDRASRAKKRDSSRAEHQAGGDTGSAAPLQRRCHIAGASARRKQSRQPAGCLAAAREERTSGGDRWDWTGGIGEALARRLRHGRVFVQTGAARRSVPCIEEICTRQGVPEPLAGTL